MNINIRFERGFIKPDKDSILRLLIILVLAILVVTGLFYYFEKPSEIIIQEPPGDPMKAILRSLTAPNEGEPISEEMLKNLSAPSDSSAFSDEEEEAILKSLTAPK